MGGTEKNNEAPISGSSMAQKSEFRKRVLVAVSVMFLCFLVLAARLFWLQVVHYDSFTTQAESNRIQSVPLPPSRGVIRDRNGVVMAESFETHSLEITRSSLEDGLEPTLDRLSEIVSITNSDRRRFRRLASVTKRLTPIPIRQELTDEEVARFLVRKWQFPGVDIVTRRLRRYPLGATGSHIIGYTGRIADSDAKRLEAEGKNDEYKGTYNIGKVGIERSYEDVLRGTRGCSTYEVTAGGQPVRHLETQMPVNGRDLTLSIDSGLQKAAEEAFGDSTGALVAIEPSSGEILAFVSVPTYDPNLFLNGIDFDSWDELNTSPKKPLLNRPLQGTYPIGSTYKPFMALAGLHYGQLTQKSKILDTGVFELAGHKFRDSSRGHIGTVDLRKSLVVSCDVFYYMLANDLGVDKIHDYMENWDFGGKTGIDLAGERRGVLPSPDWKKRRFGRSWAKGDTVSLGIGQGYNSFTILQLAHATATLANGGVALQPRLVRSISNPDTGISAKLESSYRKTMPSSKKDIDFVKNAMAGVIRSGTAAKVFSGAKYSAAGKTGTAQVLGIAQDKTYDEKKVKKQHKDHGLFIAFAPLDKPAIAVAVIVENGGWGASSAGPIARKVLDFWLAGEGRQESAEAEPVRTGSGGRSRK